MSTQPDLSIHPEPYWLQEAFACMNYVHALDSEEWVNKSSGWSRPQREEFLVPYRSYRDAMKARLQPVLEQYPLLQGYVETMPWKDAASREGENLKFHESLLISFLGQLQGLLEGNRLPSEEELEAALNRAFGRMLESNLQDSPEEDVVICSLTDVMAALEHWKGTDADKLRLVRLYSERREVAEQLWSLKGVCEQIGRECMKLVQERFEACMEKLQNPDEVEMLMDQIGLPEISGQGQITPAIMLYDKIVVNMTEMTDIPGQYSINMLIGIESFFLRQSDTEELYNDNRILAKLKALGDPTRLKILHQLVEKPCYLQEMAKALELTPATVLHHLGILMSEGLIEIQTTTKEKKRVYYRVKNRGLQEASQGILSLMLTRKELESQMRTGSGKRETQKRRHAMNSLEETADVSIL